MNVLFLTSAEERLGGYWRAFYLAKYLNKRGHHVKMVCQNNNNSLRTTKKVVEDVPIYALPSFHLSKNPIRNAATIFMQIGLNSLIGHDSFDVLHVFDAPLPQNSVPAILWKMSFSSRKPVIFIDWDDWWGRGGMLDSDLKVGQRTVTPLLTFLEEKVPLLADGVTVTNETLKNRSISVGVNRSNIFLLPNGTNINLADSHEICEARKQLNLPLDAVIYCYHQRKLTFPTQLRVSPRVPKNIILLAHKTVMDSYPNSFLLLLGEGSKETLTYAKSLQLDKNVFCLDFQPENVYHLYLSACNFFLLPVENTAFTRAAIPQRLMDYMGIGRPVITTTLPEIKRLVDGCGLFIAKYDEDELSERMIEAILNPVLMKRMGENARERVKNQASWLIVAEQLERIYCKYA